jgi:anti-anti-sigma factor
MGGYRVRGAAFTADAETGFRSVKVQVTGEFDMECELATAAMVSEVLDDRPNATRLTLDLSACSFFSSSGIRFLAGVYARCALGDVAVELRPSPCVERVLALTDADSMLAALEPFALV